MTMYLQHFGLREAPFRITPHTEFFFSGANRGATLEALRGRLGPQNAVTVEIAGLYWHFVDVVWIIIFTVVYLIQ